MAKKKQLSGRELIACIEHEQMKAEVPSFNVGDTLDVGVTIREADKERIQVFTGTCISRKGEGIRETFTVRRIVQGEGVERIFPLHPPSIQSIKVVRRGRVRRAKLTYLRNRQGRSARLREDLRERTEDKATE